MQSTPSLFAIPLPADVRFAAAGLVGSGAGLADRPHGEGGASADRGAGDHGEQHAGYTPWPGLAQVFRLERTVTDGLTRLPAADADAARVLAIARAHWGLRMHDRRDATLHEAASLLRRGQGAQGLATLNTAVIGLIRHHGEHTLAAVQRCFLYQWDQALYHLSGQ